VFRERGLLPGLRRHSRRHESSNRSMGPTCLRRPVVSSNHRFRRVLGDQEMTDKATDVTVTREDRDAAIVADEGAINAARSLSNREHGALESEMRDARKE